MLVSASSASLPAASTAPSDSGPDTQNFIEQVLKNPFLVQVASAVEIDPTLTHRTDASLRI